MTLNDFVISFDPFVNSAENKEKLLDKRIIKFQAWLDFDDILEVSPLTIPSKKIDTFVDENYLALPKDHYIQIFLNPMWSKTLKNFYKDICIQMEKDNLPIASIFIKICEVEDNGLKKSEKEQQEVMMEIINKIKEILDSRREKSKAKTNFSSNIPFFDILYDNIKLVMKQGSTGEETKRKIENLHLPEMLHYESMIMDRNEFAKVTLSD